MAALHTYFIPILPQINTHLFSCRPNRHSYAHISSPRISNTTIPISRLSCYPHPPFTIYFLYHHPSNPPCYPLPPNPFSLASFCFTTILFLHHIKYPFSPPSWISMQTCHHACPYFALTINHLSHLISLCIYPTIYHHPRHPWARIPARFPRSLSLLDTYSPPCMATLALIPTGSHIPCTRNRIPLPHSPHSTQHLLNHTPWLLSHLFHSLPQRMKSRTWSPAVGPALPPVYRDHRSSPAIAWQFRFWSHGL